jgi:hypothetical protein
MRLIKMKTTELSGAALDWAVAVALGSQCGVVEGAVCLPNSDGDFVREYSPSTNWTQGGLVFAELMATGQFGVTPHYSGKGFDICNQNCESAPFDNDWSKEAIYIEGDDLLALICIAYVTHKVGEEVEVPAELMQGGAA